MYGKCRICGEEKKLTFEHVPPEATFNKRPVKIIKGDEVLKTLIDESILPWELEGLKGKIQQRGKGDYYLCEKCNSITGAFYVPFYKEFIHGIAGALIKLSDLNYDAVRISIPKFRPLAVFKQIMTMFSDINNGNMGDPLLRNFLLDRNNTIFDKDRYSLYAFLFSGSIERMNGISVMRKNEIGLVTITEIAIPPIGFALYINKPKNFTPKGVDILSFVEYSYNDEVGYDIVFPKLEVNTIISGDYRSKSEIVI